MIITVASGKGGTGKTTIAVNLAESITRNQRDRSPSTWLVDCDVEEPNAGLFIQPEFTAQQPALRLFPIIDPKTCNGCGRCATVCSYHAIAVVSDRALLFKDLCHACGSCVLNCPENAITETAEEVGWLQRGQHGNLSFAQGTLEIGYSSPVPVIRDLKKWVITKQSAYLFILDAAPGTTCPVVEAICDADFVLLVTEPTPFGLHDLKLITQMVQDSYHIPCGVIINKSGNEDAIIEDFCLMKHIPILMRLPLSRDIAEICARGELIIDRFPDYAGLFNKCYAEIQQMIRDHSKEMP